MVAPGIRRFAKTTRKIHEYYQQNLALDINHVYIYRYLIPVHIYIYIDIQFIYIYMIWYLIHIYIQLHPHFLDFQWTFVMPSIQKGFLLGFLNFRRESPKRCWRTTDGSWEFFVGPTVHVGTIYFADCFTLSKKSPTGPSEWTPKPEYLIALAPYLGVHW